MNLLPENFSEQNQENLDQPSPDGQTDGSSAVPQPGLAVPGAVEPGGGVRPTIPYGQRPDVPEDLRISWSWVHLLCFILFSFAGLVIVQTVLAIHYAPHEELSTTELQQYLIGIPQFVVGTTVALFAIIFFFLYITVSVLPGQPFWRSLGWRRLPRATSRFRSRPWFYLALGSVLSLIVSVVGSRVHTPENMPIEALMKSHTGFILMMGMAVLLAPLAEETLFRGYLYPLLVRLVSTSSQYFGADPAKATRRGMTTSVIVTGILFGLLHGAQLSWTWGIVSLLILVGIVFTYVRAQTGTVLASFLMHFGYNLLIAIGSLFDNPALRNLPPHS